MSRIHQVLTLLFSAGAAGATLTIPNVAQALAGGAAADATDASFAAYIQVGRSAACSGALVAPRWLLTAKSCFAVSGGAVTAGPPAVPSTATLGRADLAQQTGRVMDIVELLPVDGRNLVLVRIREAVLGVTPLPIATGAPQPGDSLTILGYGRTSSAWAPDLLNAAVVTVGGVEATKLTSTGTEAASTCKGDSGGPALRRTASGSELVAVHESSWQRGCLGSSETRSGLTESRVDDLAQWIATNTREPSCANPTPPASIADGMLLQEPGGKVALIAAGVPLEFSTPEELTALGYGSRTKSCVPDGSIAALPRAPRERALLRAPTTTCRDGRCGTGAIYIIAGGARLPFHTWEDYLSAGYKDNVWTDVPSAALLALSESPRNGTLLHDPVTGTISVIAGGANVPFTAWQQFLDAGYKTNTWVDVPLSTIFGLPSVPTDGTLLRDRTTGSISVIAGGATIWFRSWSEYVATGYPPDWVHVPSYYQSSLPTLPTDGTLLRYPNDSMAWRVTSGRRMAVTAPAGVPVTTVPAAYLDGIPRSP